MYTYAISTAENPKNKNKNKKEKKRGCFGPLKRFYCYQLNWLDFKKPQF